MKYLTAVFLRYTKTIVTLLIIPNAPRIANVIDDIIHTEFGISGLV